MMGVKQTLVYDVSLIKPMEIRMELLDKKEFAVAAYKPFYDQLQELEKNNNAIAFDYESAKGNKEAGMMQGKEANNKLAELEGK